jgi:predicted HD superfamily hydrolase involved in NAD metabolism
MKLRFDEKMINALRENISKEMSPFRLEHTLGVEKMAVRLGELFCPEEISRLRVAALLHDVTKELSIDEHAEIYRAHSLEPSPEELSAPATLHAVTASLIIPESYADFADSEVVSAVRYHTVGRENMTLLEKLIYLADYIDETRRYADCVELRNMFFSAEPEKMNMDERSAHLNRVILRSFDMTVADILKNGRVLSTDTVKARNSIIFELKNERK